MFLTYAGAEIPAPEYEATLETKTFAFVEVVEQRLWFIGTLSEETTGGEVLHTVLVPNLDEFKEICRGWSWNLVQVDIAVPASQSATGESEFERLVAAWECEDFRHPDRMARVYCSIEGATYTDVSPPIEPFDPSKLRRLRRIYPTTKARSGARSRWRGRAEVELGDSDGTQDEGLPGTR
jgi:hypothetical protein